MYEVTGVLKLRDRKQKVVCQWLGEVEMGRCLMGRVLVLQDEHAPELDVGDGCTIM